MFVFEFFGTAFKTMIIQVSIIHFCKKILNNLTKIKKVGLEVKALF